MSINVGWFVSVRQQPHRVGRFRSDANLTVPKRTEKTQLLAYLTAVKTTVDQRLGGRSLKSGHMIKNEQS